MSFPRESSHYSRKDNPNKRFLSPDLSVQRMYNLYLEKYEPSVWEREKVRLLAKQQNSEMPAAIPPNVSYAIYRRTFNTEVSGMFYYILYTNELIRRNVNALP